MFATGVVHFSFPFLVHYCMPVDNDEVREIVKNNAPARFNFCPSFGFDEYQKLNSYKTIVPTYIKDYVSLNTFMT